MSMAMFPRDRTNNQSMPPWARNECRLRTPAGCVTPTYIKADYNTGEARPGAHIRIDRETTKHGWVGTPLHTGAQEASFDPMMVVPIYVRTDARYGDRGIIDSR